MTYDQGVAGSAEGLA
ncbi:hypothetical protein KGM_211532A, partial [Danaus plexippus plexippus]